MKKRRSGKSKRRNKKKVEATELQKFKIGANAFLLGVDGL